jgi:nitrogen fixation protein NifB
MKNLCPGKNYGHPCFSETPAKKKYGRLHLPVAPKCDIKCNYCLRKYNCVNERAPGRTKRLLTPLEALEKVKECLSVQPDIRVVAVAGPGDPLSSFHAIETLSLVRNHYPKMLLCLSTNGLRLKEYLKYLIKIKLNSLSITINALDPNIGAKIYAYIKQDKNILKGTKGAEFLIKRQLEGVKLAINCKIQVKINTVFIPGINSSHIKEIAKTANLLGTTKFNIIPLIPQAQFKHIPAPSNEEIKKIQDECERYLPQFRQCKRCRADASGYL